VKLRKKMIGRSEDKMQRIARLTHEECVDQKRKGAKEIRVSKPNQALGKNKKLLGNSSRSKGGAQH